MSEIEAGSASCAARRAAPKSRGTERRYTARLPPKKGHDTTTSAAPAVTPVPGARARTRRCAGAQQKSRVRFFMAPILCAYRVNRIGSRFHPGSSYVDPPALASHAREVQVQPVGAGFEPIGRETSELDDDPGVPQHPNCVRRCLFGDARRRAISREPAIATIPSCGSVACAARSSNTSSVSQPSRYPRPRAQLSNRRQRPSVSADTVGSAASGRSSASSNGAISSP
jgi:hypothetical protein